MDKAGGVKGFVAGGDASAASTLEAALFHIHPEPGCVCRFSSQVKTILAWDFHISPEDTCPKAIVT